MFDIYTSFVRARHQVWRARQAGQPQPWTDDPIVASRKFTNVFRILDYGTQFVVKELLYDDSITFHDALMRVFLYRYTNRPEPWEYFHQVVGRYPLAEDLGGQLEDVWETHKRNGGKVFGSAYKMFSGYENRGMDRLTWILELTEQYFRKPDLALNFHRTGSQEERLNLLKTIPRCANFMGMQILTDVGYSTWIQSDENDFIVAGPGAKLGAKHVDPDETAETTIHELKSYWDREGDVVLDGRTPSLMDVQNTLCEFGKYVRWTGEGPRKPYDAQHRAEPPFLPPHWKGTEA